MKTPIFFFKIFSPFISFFNNEKHYTTENLIIIVVFCISQKEYINLDSKNNMQVNKTIQPFGEYPKRL
ncbi:hypothetical protein UNSWDHB_1538 [Dehalobacter sp. UNSWDHB]|nr:hypothetical protein UNSWDHB_1538 [Dehalobacter sp. UNSWDHB]